MHIFRQDVQSYDSNDTSEWSSDNGTSQKYHRSFIQWLVTNMIHGIIWHIKYSILTCSLYVISFLGLSPNIRLNAKILNVEKYNDASKLSISPYIYTIEISYGDHQWTIKRRYYIQPMK